MSPPSAIALVQSYYDAFNRRDWPAMVALLSEDVAHDINQGHRETGREAFRDFLLGMDRSYRERLVDVVVMASADGSRAAAEYTVEGVYRSTQPGLPEARDQPYRLGGGAFFEIHDGRITRVSSHYNLGAWLAQVGS
ncbi:MAG: nuclear transport factor 2 family protein [Xanthomonadales bacterium]|nr:nuclear transport factor 2 family protein [Xanthomonadales bacterium]